MVKMLTRYMMVMMKMMMMMMTSHQVHDQGEECERWRQERVRVKELDGKVEPGVPHKRFVRLQERTSQR